MHIWAVSSFQVCAHFFRVCTNLYISRIENPHGAFLFHILFAFSKYDCLILFIYISKLFKKFILSIVDLQCFVSFRYTAKWFSYTHIHSFLILFPSHIIPSPCWFIFLISLLFVSVLFFLSSFISIPPCPFLRWTHISVFSDFWRKFFTGKHVSWPLFSSRSS